MGENIVHGYINLPKWRDYFLKKLVELDLRDMVSCPVMGRETAEAPWQTLDSDEFYSSVNTAISFLDDEQSYKFNGKLVTSNSETAIRRLISNNYANTFFNGAIGGVSVFLRSLESAYQTSKPVKFFAQNDGVVSYILSAIENSGKSLDEAINQSQWEKIADSSPIKNIHGLVARDRFILLMAEIFGVFLAPNEFSSVGINNLDITDVLIAKSIGFSIRLLGIAEKTSTEDIKATLEPCLIPSAYMLAQARGGSEMIYLKSSDGLSQVYGCPGASMDTCINGILHDLFDSKCSHKFNRLNNSQYLNLREFENSFYVRLETSDKTFALASVFNCFNESGIKILSINEPKKNICGNNSLETTILITDKTTRKKISDCVENINLNVSSASVKSFYRYINQG